MRRKTLLTSVILIAGGALLVGCGGGANGSLLPNSVPPPVLPSTQSQIAGQAQAMQNAVFGVYSGTLHLASTGDQPYSVKVGTTPSGGTNVFTLAFNSSGSHNLSFTRQARWGIDPATGSPAAAILHLITYVGVGQPDPYSQILFPDLNDNQPVLLRTDLAFINGTDFDPSRSTIYLLDCGSYQLSCNTKASTADQFVGDVSKTQ